MEASELNEHGMKLAKRLGAEDAVFISSAASEQMVRFANDSLSVAKKIEERVLSVYLAKDAKRIVGVSTNVESEGVDEFVKRLYKTLTNLSRDASYVPLPNKARRFEKPGPYDPKAGEAEKEVAEFARLAIESAREAGAKRSAGSVTAELGSVDILTSSGTTGHDVGSSALLNIRSFVDAKASGHGLSCSSTLKGIDAAAAGRRAGEYAKGMADAAAPEEGTYTVLLSPTVAANLISLIGGFASAFSVEAGISYLAEKVGKKVASESFSLTDHGRISGGLGGRTFDDEGTPTQSTKIIEGGVLRNYLHNLSTSKKFKASSTGNAGWIDPNPWNLEVGAGDSTFSEMVREMKRGIVLTSNWYTRFTNYRTGEFSTVPRDGAFLVEDGRQTKPLSGMRMSDSLERLFSSVLLLSKQREWIQWWEVDEPTLCPWVLVEGVKITRAYGSSP